MSRNHSYASGALITAGDCWLHCNTTTARLQRRIEIVALGSNFAKLYGEADTPTNLNNNASVTLFGGYRTIEDYSVHVAAGC